MKDHVRAIALDAVSKKPKAYAESEGRARQVWAHEDTAGFVDAETRGKPPQGEEDSLSTCAMFVRKRNLDGAGLNEPRQPTGREQGVDGIATYKDGSGELQLQVTRADVEKYPLMALTGVAVEKSASPQQLADRVTAAIEKKAGKSSGKGIILLVDVTEAPALAMGVVVPLIQVPLTTFDEVWLVGPDVTMVVKLS